MLIVIPSSSFILSSYLLEIMKRSLYFIYFLLFGLGFVLKVDAQSGSNWAWHVDTTIAYTDLKYSQDKIYGLGQALGNGILALKDSNGNSLWMHQFSGIEFVGLDVSSSGELVALGFFSDSVIVNGTTYFSSGGKEVIIVRCDVMGGITLVKTFGSIADDIPFDLCIDALGGIYITANCWAPVSQSGNNFSGQVISKFDNLGNPVFLHNLRTASTIPPTEYGIRSIKYNPVDSLIYFTGFMNSGSTDVFNTFSRCIFDSGIDSILISSHVGLNGRDIILGRITTGGQLGAIVNETQAGGKTYYSTDMAINDSGKVVYTVRDQYTLNGFTKNYWTLPNAELNSDGHTMIDACGLYYTLGHPLKLETDGVDFYGSIYQPELSCSTQNCSDYYLMQYKLSIQSKNYQYIQFKPLGVCGHAGNYYVGAVNGLYKSCNSNCPLQPLIVTPSADLTMCVGNSDTIGNIPCLYVHGGTEPYSFSWQPNIGLNNPNSSNPVVSGLGIGIYTYTLTVTDQNTVISYDTVVVEVKPPPIISVTLNPMTPVCGDSLLIIPSGASNYSYHWLDNLNNYHYAYGDSLLLFPNYSTTIQVIGIDGCNDTNYVPVNVASSMDTTYATVCESNLPYVWYGQSI